MVLDLGDDQLRVVGLAHLVFAREDGAPYAQRLSQRHSPGLAREAGLRPVRLHDLRHGQASLLLAARVPLTVYSAAWDARRPNAQPP